MNEKWVNIKGYEDCYAISSLGRIRSLRKNVIMKQGVSNSGYKIVGMHKYNQPSISAKIHRLVAIHFVPNPNCKKEVNHIDGNKFNNAASNLEWSTRKENQVHAHKNGLIRPRTTIVITPKDVIDIYNSILIARELSSIYGVSETYIRNIKNGHRCASITGAKPMAKKEQTKLDAAIVMSVYLSDMAYKEIAKKYNIGVWVVSSIKNGYRYARITTGEKNKNQ